jgi:hypothetical protein
MATLSEKERPMTETFTTAVEPAALPPFVWAVGKIRQILVQPGEKFYVFALRQTDGETVLVRIADAHTGFPLAGLTADNLVYDLLKEAYLRDLTVEVGYRDFGPDPQAGLNKLCIDRVSLSQ